MKRTTKAAVSIFATATLCAFAETVVETAPDGVNTLEYDVVDGMKYGAKSTCVYVPDPIQVYRLELRVDGDGETAFLVGQDGVKRAVVLVEPMEYKLLTERLDAVWQSLNATADGRRKLHGKLERTEIDEKACQKVEIYADGFRHTESLPVKRMPAESKKTRLELRMAKQREARLLEDIEERRPEGMSDKRWQMRKAILKHRLGIPKQVTVEHDAVTGKDTILEGK